MHTGQTYKNHVRYDPAFHFTLIPACLLLIVGAIGNIWVHWGHIFPWYLLAWVIVFTYACFMFRIYALRNQDRIIRLEETLRLSKLCPDVAARVPEFDPSQLAALRFCSDAELPALAKKALEEKLSNQAIKEAIKDWRGDYSRV